MQGVRAVLRIQRTRRAPRSPPNALNSVKLPNSLNVSELSEPREPVEPPEPSEPREPSEPFESCEPSWFVNAPFFSPALSPAFSVGRGDWRLDNLLPVEDDARVLRFESLSHFCVEWFASDLHAGGRAKPVEHARAGFPAAVRGRLDKIEMFVAPLVATETQKSQLLFLLFDRGLLCCGLFLRRGLGRSFGRDRFPRGGRRRRRRLLLLLRR